MTRIPVCVDERGKAAIEYGLCIERKRTGFRLKLYYHMNPVPRQKLRSLVRFLAHFPTACQPAVSNEP